MLKPHELRPAEVVLLRSLCTLRDDDTEIYGSGKFRGPTQIAVDLEIMSRSNALSPSLRLLAILGHLEWAEGLYRARPDGQERRFNREGEAIGKD